MNHRKQLIKHLAICLFISLFTGTLSFAQLGRANHHYEHKEYARAIPFYEKAYKKNHTQEITIQLAECYRFTHDYTKAETLYEKALKQDSTNIELLQYYTEVLKKNKKLKQVKEVFVVYAIKNPNISAQDFMLSVDELMSWGAKKPQFKVENVEAVNTKFSDFSPVPYNGGIAFVSERNNNYVNDNVDYGWTQRPYLSVYYVDQNTDSTFTKPKLFSPAINDEYHNGPIAFDNQQNEAIFTRVSNLRKGKNYTNKPQLYISQKKGKKWQKAESFEHNDENHSFAHPSVSADGQWLYFVSDMPGGQGGKDLYVSKREGNSWSKPQNLGPTINTARDEIFPYIHKNGTLYFSSNGHTGYGGLDIFSAKKINAKWNDPENLREPLNSSTDDFGIVFIDSITGYISSNREGGKGADDIYTFKMLPKEKSTSIKGLFMYSELNPAKNAKVRLLDANNVEIAITNTDDEGNFEFKNLKPNEDYIVVIDQDDVKLIDESRVYLVNEQGEKVIQLSQKSKGFFIFHALPAEVYNKLPTLLAQDEKLSILTIYGQVFEKLPGDIPPDMQLYVLNDQGQIIYTTTIDEKGNFVLKNLPPDNNYTFKLKDPNIEAKVMILNQNREPLGTIEKTEEGFIYHRYDFMKPKNAVDLFGRAYDKLPGDLTPGMEVYLVNDKGEIIYTAVIDEKGNFEFKNLPPDQNYIVKLKAADVDFQVFILDEEGDEASMQQNEKGDFVYETLTADKTEVTMLENKDEDNANIMTVSFFGQVYEELPGDITQGMEVYLVNEDGEIIYTAYIDEKGNFEFKNLPPDYNYIFKLKEEDVDFKLMVIDEENGTLEEIEKDESGEFVYETLATDKSSRITLQHAKDEDDATMITMSFFGQVYEKLPGDITPGMKVYLVNEDGEIVYTAYIDEKGNFEFKNLPPDHNYIFKMKEEDVGFKLMVMDEEDGTLEEIKKDESGNFIYETLVADKSSRVTMQQAKDETDDRLLTVGFFGQVYQKLPGDVPEGMKVYLVNDEGEIMYEAVVDEKGNFEFKNLPPDHNYIFKIEAEDSDIKLIAFDKQGKKIEEIKANTKGEFVYERIASDEASLTIANETNEEIVVKKGDSYVLSNIYYDVAKWEVNPRSSKELDKLAAMMKKNPHVAVALSSHTDCRGQNTFNMALSQVRAEYAVNYIVSKGIAKNRIMGKGYGETVPVSPCNNCEQCSHNKHYENRRTEIKIVKKHW